MHRGARHRARQQIREHDAAMIRHEHIAQLQRAAAGTRETDYMPVVNDLDLA